mgnify:CR=1 FL=1
MTYRAGWYLMDGVTVSSGLDLGEVKPGETKTITRKLKNTGDQALSGVQFTLQTDLPGISVKVNDVSLTYNVTHTSPALAPGETLTVEYSRTVPADANPGTFSAFILIRALT